MLRFLSVALCALGLFLTACGSSSPVDTVAKEQACPAAQACLQLSLAHSAEVQAQASLPAPTFKQATFDPHGPVILEKDGHLSRLPVGADLSDLYSQGYRVENDQQLGGFGGTGVQGHLDLLQAEDLWRISQGIGVTVAVIDSGVDPQHEALKQALLPGYDFLTEGTKMQDPHGHGTAVAALIAGQGSVRGLAPKARILPLRVLDEHNQGSAYDVSRAVLYAADLLPELPNPHKADVINLSLGGYSYSETLHRAIRRARQAGLLVVAAAGNLGQDGLAYPAALPEVVAVGAARVNDGAWQLQAYSNYGAGLAVLAPTGGVTQTQAGSYGEATILSAEAGSVNGAKGFSGTSVAAPQVSGLAALILALGHQADEAEAILLGSSTDLGSPGWDAETGYGLINPAASLRAAARTVSARGPFAVQLLDAGSQQELSFHAGDTAQTLEVAPGHYTLKVWHDANRDGLWQASEALFQDLTTAIELANGKIHPLELKLHAF